MIIILNCKFVKILRLTAGLGVAGEIVFRLPSP